MSSSQSITAHYVECSRLRSWALQRRRNKKAAKHLSLYALLVVAFTAWIWTFIELTSKEEIVRLLEQSITHTPFLASGDSKHPYFKTFPEITTNEEFWKWFEDIAAERLLVDPAAVDGHKFQHAHFILWGIRLRTLRVRPGADCENSRAQLMGSRLTGMNKTELNKKMKCGASYRDDTKDIRSYGESQNSTGAQANHGGHLKEYEWQDSSEHRAHDIKGRFATYDGSGYVVDVPLLNAGAVGKKHFEAPVLAAQIAALRKNYLDGFTRAVITTCAMYCPYNGLFVEGNWIVEHDKTHLLVPQTDHYVEQLHPFTSGWRYVLSVAEIVVACACALMQVVRAGSTIVVWLNYHSKNIRSRVFWGIYDLVLGSLIMYIGTRVILKGAMTTREDVILRHIQADEPMYLANDLQYESGLKDVAATTYLLLILRATEFFLGTGRLAMAVIIETGRLAAFGLGSFLLTIVVVLMGWGAALYVIYATQVYVAHTPESIAHFATRSVLGVLNHDVLMIHSPFLTLLPKLKYFIAIFYKLFFYCLQPIIIAVIFHAWQRVRARPDHAKGRLRGSASKRSRLEKRLDNLCTWGAASRCFGFRPQRLCHASSAGISRVNWDVLEADLAAWQNNVVNVHFPFLDVGDLTDLMKSSPVLCKSIGGKARAEVVAKHIFAEVADMVVGRAFAEKLAQNSDPDGQIPRVNVLQVKLARKSLGRLEEARKEDHSEIMDAMNGIRAQQEMATSKLVFLLSQELKPITSAWSQMN